LTLRWPGTCVGCGRFLPSESRAVWLAENRHVPPGEPDNRDGMTTRLFRRGIWCDRPGCGPTIISLFEPAIETPPANWTPEYFFA